MPVRLVKGVPEDYQADDQIARLPNRPAYTLVVDSPYWLHFWRWGIPVENESQHQHGQDCAAPHQKNFSSRFEGKSRHGQDEDGTDVQDDASRHDLAFLGCPREGTSHGCAPAIG